MKFSQWCQRFIFAVFVVFGCSGFYPTGKFAVKRSLACRLYGLIFLLTFSSYYYWRFDESKQFFLKSNEKLNLIYFEFNIYWFVSIVAFSSTVLNGGKVAVWFERVTNALARCERVATTSLFLALILSVFLYFLNSSIYVFTSFKSRNQPDMSAFAAVLYFILTGTSAITVLQIMTGKLFLVFLLRQLRLELSRFLRMAIRSRSYGISPRDSVSSKKLLEIMSRHHEYSVLELEFNDLFSVQTVLFTILDFVELTYSTYYFLSFSEFGILFSSAELRFIFCFSYFNFYMCQFLQYTISYELIQDQFQEFKRIIISSLSDIDDTNGRLRDLMETFLIQCENLNGDAMPSGFFKIGHVLIQQMFGKVTSALVILFQFERLQHDLNVSELKKTI